MQIEEMFRIEGLYEHRIASLTNLSQYSFGHYLEALLELENRNFACFYSKMSVIYDAAILNQEKAFILSWLIVGTEVQYDMTKRHEYLIKLQNLRSQELNLYIEFLCYYFDSISSFFDGLHDISEVQMKKALSTANLINYKRGQSRSYYHLALIYKEKKNLLQAKQMMTCCYDICVNEDFTKTKNKVISIFDPQDNSKNENIENIESTISKIKYALKENDLDYARQLIVKAEILRRKQKIGRKRFSLYYYRIQYLFMIQNVKYGRKLLEKLKDPVLLQKNLSFMKGLRIPLNHSESEQLKQLNYKLFDMIDGISLENIYVSKVRNELIRKLFCTLNQKQIVSKENLFESVYGISYDPVVHDSKLYKLIGRARKDTFSDVIINDYGSYSLNYENYNWIFND